MKAFTTAGAQRKAVALAVAAAAVAIAACGGGGGGETAATDGPTIFADSGCGNCHGFDAANADGRVGPDLDVSTMDVDAVVEKVRSGGGGMPAFGELTDGQLETLAEYVVAERGGG